jgi:hypothetical protein
MNRVLSCGLQKGHQRLARAATQVRQHHLAA